MKDYRRCPDLREIDLSQSQDVSVGKTDAVFEEGVGSAVNAVDLVEGCLQEEFSRGKQMIERECRADIEHDGNTEEDKRVDEAAGAVGAHIIAHDDLSIYAECHEGDRGGNARAVLALRAVPQKGGVFFVSQEAKHFSERLKRFLLRDHQTVYVGKVLFGAAFLCHDLDQHALAVFSVDRGILLVVQGREVDVIDALCHNVLMLRKLRGTAKVDDRSQALAIAQKLRRFLRDLVKMAASVKLAFFDFSSVCRGKVAEVTEIFEFSEHFEILRYRSEFSIRII